MNSVEPAAESVERGPVRLVASVVIPTHNRWSQLRRVLDGFAEEASRVEPFEVLVCDDASDDDTAAGCREYALAAPYTVVHLRQAKRGPAAARNLGLAVARAPVVVFTDDDCIPQPGFLARHVASTRVGVATIGRIAWHPEVPVTPFMHFLCPGYMFNYARIADRHDAPYTCFYTANVSVATADLRALGGFDEAFPAAAFEDIELGYRLKRAGVRLVYDEDAVIHHLHQMGLERTLARQIVNGRSAAYAVTKHPDMALESGVPGLRDPGLAYRFFHAALDYYFMVGLQQGFQNVFNAEWADKLDDLLLPYPGFIDGIELRYYESGEYARRLEARIAMLEHENALLADWARGLEARLAPVPSSPWAKMAALVMAAVARARHALRCQRGSEDR